MDTSIPLPFLPSLDLTSEEDGYGDGLTPTQLSYLGCVHIAAGPQSIDTLLQYLEENNAIEAYVDVSAIESEDDIFSILNAGAKKIFVKSTQLKTLDAFADRVVPIVNSGDSSQAYPNGVLLASENLEGAEASLKKLATWNTKPIYITTSSTDEETIISLAKEHSAVPIILATSLTAERASQDKISISALIAGTWTSDRADKLIATMVTDERGIALGLVYSDAMSLAESLRTGTGVYQSRKRGLWYKGATSGSIQHLVRISLDCDQDCLRFMTLVARKASAPEGSYTARLFSDEKLLRAKIMEEAEELCDAKTKEEVAFEAADLIYFALAKAVSAGVGVADIERNIDAKSMKVKRRQGDAKDPKSKDDPADRKNGRISMRRYNAATTSTEELKAVLQRPSQRSTETIMGIVNPIIKSVQAGGDKALLEYTHKFEKATSLTSPVLKAPFPQSLMNLPPEIIEAIDISYENIRKFHAAQKEDKPLHVETMPGIVCSRFARPIERVGLYVPGGTAVLPSTALMLGVPAMVAGCKTIVLASPPRADGSITPEIIYVAHKIGADAVVLAGGAQAVAAMAYGTESVPKVDKILGPGNQFVTAAKMFVSNDTNAGVGIDMPAGPSEVLVIADKDANPAFVASDLLSQAEHGVDSQVVLIAIDFSEKELAAIEEELHNQAVALPRVDLVRGAIEHSVTLVVKDVAEAMALSNDYAPEHLILQMKDAASVVDLVQNAGSVFIGEWTPESVGDYSAGVNHSLLLYIYKIIILILTSPATYGYAKQYSGVNLGSFTKHITSSHLTAQGLRNVGSAVMQLAKVEELEAHRRAVSIRIKYMDEKKI
ncbi:hypothetical protein PZA11_005865 [Diplocarpon coronariae]